ncbi:hypothetical protein Tco_0050464 [Tanacetum coccineum]
MVVDEGVPAELTGSRTTGAGETGLSTRGGSRHSSNIGWNKISSSLFVGGVHKVLQELNWVRALNLSVQASENQEFINKLCAIIGTDVSDSFVETNLYLLQKFDDELWGFIFRSQKLDLSKPIIVINDD